MIFNLRGIGSFTRGWLAGWSTCSSTLPNLTEADSSPRISVILPGSCQAVHPSLVLNIWKSLWAARCSHFSLRVMPLAKLALGLALWTAPPTVAPVLLLLPLRLSYAVATSLVPLFPFLPAILHVRRSSVLTVLWQMYPAMSNIPVLALHELASVLAVPV